MSGRISENRTIVSAVLDLLSTTSGISVEKITKDMNIIDDLGMDSFSIVEIVYELEMKFDVQVRNEDLKKIKTVADVIELVETKKI
jgi:acyl carrier protein